MIPKGSPFGIDTFSKVTFKEQQQAKFTRMLQTYSILKFSLLAIAEYRDCGGGISVM